MRPIYKLAIVFAWLLCAAGTARAQSPTRSTPCDPATPVNAICVTWTPPATMVDGTPTVLALTYRVTRKLGTGTFTTLTSTAVSQYYDKGLAPGTYTYVVYANCTGCTESAGSNSASKDATAPIVQPNPPVIQVVQVTISSNHAPVYRVVGDASRYTRGEMFGLVPVGRECKGQALFRYRGKAFYFVDVKPEELWGTTDATRLAAPCA